MFQFPRLPACRQSSTLTRHYSRWVPPFGYPRIKARLTAPRGLSQPDCALLRLLAPGHPPCALRSFPRLLPGFFAISPVQFVTCRVAQGKEPTVPNPSPASARRLPPIKSGGEGIRTPDLLRAREALHQLSYAPMSPKPRWAFVDSNHRPRSYQDRALTT